MEMLIMVFLIGIAWYYWDLSNKRIYRRIIEKVPGPTIWPFIGNCLLFVGLPTEEFFKKFNYLSWQYDRFFRMWVFGRLYIVLTEPKDIERVLTDNANLTKSDLYRFLLPWIGDGLLTSTGSKWRRHRKAITPAFHFNSLDGFLEVFNKNGKILSECLEIEVGKGPFNLFNYINRAALDNICETAMGVEYNIQKTLNSDYLKAVKTICRTATTRIYETWLWTDFVFSKTAHGADQRKAIKFIDNSTLELIQKRRKVGRGVADENPTDEFRKTNLSFLDILLHSAGTEMTDEEIRDEINTFMFEGHDTVSSGTSFLLYTLANHQDIQEKVYQELRAVLGDIDEPLTMAKLSELPYLQNVIKESLRLYPPSAGIARMLDEDLVLNDGIVLPKGTNIIVNIFATHRTPKVWPNADKFDPENFSSDIQPFAYFPFSAGSRNCIGQKFAMLEMKTVVSYILRKYRLLPSSDPAHQLVLTNELVLISKTGQHISIEKR